MSKINAIITGVGGYVPDYVLNNEELSRMVDTNDEWIMSRVGIKERRILNEEGLGSYLMSCTPLDRNLFISFMATIIVFSISKIDYVPTTFICWLGSMYMYYRYGFAEHTGLFTIIWIVVAVLSIHPARYANNHFDDLLSRSDHYRNSSSRLVRLRWGYVFNRYFAYCFGFNILISMLCVQIMQIF